MVQEPKYNYSRAPGPYVSRHIGVWIIRHRHARPGGGYGSPRSPFADSHGADIGAVFERWLGHVGPCSYYSAHRDARSDG